MHLGAAAADPLDDLLLDCFLPIVADMLCGIFVVCPFFCHRFICDVETSDHGPIVNRKNQTKIWFGLRDMPYQTLVHICTND